MFKKNSYANYLTLLISIIWVISWLYLLINNYDVEKEGFGGIGAYLSGIFAPVAWLWLVLGYYLQRKEYGLQREELKLQRKALEKQVEELNLTREELQNSVVAQQGSEKALLNQSICLEKQLNITTKQFEMYVEKEKSKAPRFRLDKINIFNIEYSTTQSQSKKTLDILDEDLDLSVFDKNDCYSIDDIEIHLEVANVGFSSEITDITNNIRFKFKKALQTLSFYSAIAGNSDNYVIEINLCTRQKPSKS